MSKMPEPGSKAPDFTVNNQDGKPVKLSSFKGKKVVLYFYPNDETPGCTEEACNLRDNYKMLLKQGYEVLGISTNTEAQHQKFIKKEKLPFQLLVDVDKAVHKKYGTWGEKSMFGNKFMGTLRTTFIIDEKGVIEDVIRAFHAYKRWINPRSRLLLVGSHGGFERYLAMLSAGGTKHYSELLKPFGLDAKDPAFWDGGLSVIESLIAELEAMG